MTRLALPALLVAAAAATYAGLSLLAGCGAATSAGSDDGEAGATRRDAAPVEPLEGGAYQDAGSVAPPTCSKYCALVTSNCTGSYAQYESEAHCLAFCAHLPRGEAVDGDDGRASPTLACRQSWADSPARTDPNGACLAAGPFGGNVCGDRCTAFCDVLLDACSPRGGIAVYETRPDCMTACARFTFRDAGADGGGEGPSGPAEGDTLNCRLYQLRAAARDAAACVSLAPDGPCDP